MITLDFVNEFGKKLVRELISLIDQIPEGKVSTFNEIAKALGDSIARKFVWQYHNKAKYWYRVINSRGIVANPIQKALLQKEGIKFEGNKIANLEKYLFREFKTSYPLRVLKEIQNKLAKRVIIEGEPNYSKVYGADISYSNNIANVVVAEFSKDKRLQRYWVKRYKVDFPYIPSYLAFREGPPIIEALRDLDLENTILVINGHGIAHPRRLGLASFVGVVLDKPTIGNTKKLLVGSIKDNKIILNNEVVGFKINNFYVSPGHKVSLDFVRNFSEKWKGKKYLIPIEVADRISEQIKR